MSVEPFSPLPLMNKLLVIAKDEAAKNGHIIVEFHRFVFKKEPIHEAECIVCHATVRVVCTALKYERTGSAFAQVCKPG